jgi:1-pyrroline-5-carboxylate dehydrogenase
MDPWTLSPENPYEVKNLLQGEWVQSAKTEDIPDPLTGETFYKIADTQINELEPFMKSLNSCPKSGLHNPFKNPERYLMLGEVSAKAAYLMKQPENLDYFTKLIQRVAPKSDVRKYLHHSFFSALKSLRIYKTCSLRYHNQISIIISMT